MNFILGKDDIWLYFRHLFAAITRFLSTLFLNKFIAANGGSSWLLITGHFQNTLSVLSGFGTGGTQSGVIAGISANSDKNSRQSAIISAALIIALISTLCFFTFWIFNWSTLLPLDLGIFQTSILFSLVIIGSYNVLCISILTGLGELEFVSKSNFGQSMGYVILVSILFFHQSLFLILLILASVQSLTFVFNCYKLREVVGSRGIFIVMPRKEDIVDLLKYGATSLSTSLVGPLSLIFLRLSVERSGGLLAAGHWEVLNRITSIQSILFSTLLTNIFLPVFSREKSLSFSLKALKKSVLTMSGLFVFLWLIIFLFWDFLISVFFDKQFQVLSAYLGLQFFSDMMRMFIWIFSIYFLSRKWVGSFFVIDLIGPFLLVTLVSFFHNLTVSLYLIFNVSVSFLVLLLYLYRLNVKVRRNDV